MRAAAEHGQEDELNPASRGDLFNQDGSLNDAGAEKFMRVNVLLEELAKQCGSTRNANNVMADFLVWRENQRQEF